MGEGLRIGGKRGQGVRIEKGLRKGEGDGMKGRVGKEKC